MLLNLIPILVGLLLLTAWLRPKGRKELRAYSLFFVLLTAVGRPCVIPTGSMEPTIHSWDWVVLSHAHAHLSLERGDVICFPGPEGKPYCKRLIGMGGDTLEMKSGKLWINGTPARDDWAVANDESWGPIQVAPGRLFVMGDNRPNSHDSRYWGTIPREFVTGRALGIGFPPHHWRKL